MMNLIILALAPVFIIAGYIYFRDKYEKEPLRLLLAALICGAATVIPVLFMERLIVSLNVFPGKLMSAFWDAFAVAAFSEEFMKYVALYLLIWKSPEFNEKFDGIVYAVFISLGFAGIENILYVTAGGVHTGLMRIFTAVPAHAIFGIAMGFYFGLARFYPDKRKVFRRKSFLYPFLLHGVYDFILMTEIQWLMPVFFLFVIFLYFLGWTRIKELSEKSIYRTDYELLNQKFTKSES